MDPDLMPPDELEARAHIVVPMGAPEQQALAEAIRSTQHTIARFRVGDGPWQEFDDRENRDMAAAILAALTDYRLVPVAELERLRAIRRGVEELASHHILFRREHGNIDPECWECRTIAPLIKAVADEDRILLAEQGPHTPSEAKPGTSPGATADAARGPGGDIDSSLPVLAEQGDAR